MRVRRLLPVLLAAVLALGGCRVSGEVENQAYVLVLGVDRLADGSMRLTARVPQIGKSAEPGKDAGSAGYLTFSGSGFDYPQALKALEQATPRQSNLSHIKMIVVSEALASEADFAALIAHIAQTPHLYTTARFVICEGEAKDFVDAQRAVIGTRLSTEIEAMLDQYAQYGYIPRSSFAEAYYLSNSAYADPVAIHATLQDAQSADAPAAAQIDPPAPDDSAAQSPMRLRYSGAALFRNGQWVGTLDAGQTQLLGLIRGQVASLPFSCDGRAFTLTREGAVRREVKIDAGGVALSAALSFTTLDDVCEADIERLESSLSEALADLIRTCQALGTDPFGFADSAAGFFATLPAWQAFDWRSRYREATVTVNVEIRSQGL